MADLRLADSLRQRRLSLALSQRELAALSGVPQPNIAAYERGRWVPTTETLSRLEAILGRPTLEGIRSLRESILAAAQRRSLSNVRVFGSVARGEADADSDVDLLVHPSAQASVFDLAGFMSEMEELLGTSVDVVSDRGSGPRMERIRSEAVAL